MTRRALAVECVLYHENVVGRIALPTGEVVWIRVGGQELVARTERAHGVGRDRVIDRRVLGGFLLDGDLEFRSVRALPEQESLPAGAPKKVAE